MKRISGKDMCRVLERNGWVLVRVRGAHHRYEKPGHQPLTIPVHGTKTLHPKTQTDVMKEAGLSEDDL
jgi:predicted RNA binding protein YcfA (HicA-like mRNA interferase family)